MDESGSTECPRHTSSFAPSFEDGLSMTVQNVVQGRRLYHAVCGVHGLSTIREHTIAMDSTTVLPSVMRAMLRGAGVDVARSWDEGRSGKLGRLLFIASCSDLTQIQLNSCAMH